MMTMMEIAVAPKFERHGKYSRSALGLLAQKNLPRVDCSLLEAQSIRISSSHRTEDSIFHRFLAAHRP